ncbi:MAG: hypothetical protein E7055_10275 [Lentisphaerae bacterium]|nr:hypothetical protein [Lentisphaerota bacterium]
MNQILKIAIPIVICILEIMALQRNGGGEFAYVIIAVTLPFSFYYFFRIDSLKKHFYKLSLFAYCFFSLLIPAAFRFVPYSDAKMYREVYESSFTLLSSFSIFILFSFFFGIFVFSNLFQRESAQQDPPKQIHNIPNKPFVVFFIIIYSITLICWRFGIGVMGAEYVTLPFHLTAVLWLSRADFIPIIFLFMIARYRLHLSDKKSLIIFLAWGLWGVLEMIASLSKASALTAFLPLVIYYLLISQYSKKFIVRLSILCLVILVIYLGFYRVIEALRESGGTSITKEDTLYVATWGKDDVQNDFVRPFTRIFMSGFVFLKVAPYVENHQLFDFSLAGEIIDIGGTDKFVTYIVDSYDEGVAHSSGASGIVDALLYGGQGTCMLFVFFLAAIACYADSKSCPGNSFVLAAAWKYYYILIYRTSFSIFLHRDIVVTFLVAFIMIIFFNKKLNKDSDLQLKNNSDNERMVHGSHET